MGSLIMSPMWKIKNGGSNITDEKSDDVDPDKSYTCEFADFGSGQIR